VTAILAFVVAVAVTALCYLGSQRCCKHRKIGVQTTAENVGSEHSRTPTDNPVAGSTTLGDEQLMKALVAVPLFSAMEGTSQHTGVLQAGQTVRVLQVVADSKGKMKVQHDHGWTPLHAPSGELVFENVGTPAILREANPAADDGHTQALSVLDVRQPMQLMVCSGDGSDKHTRWVWVNVDEGACTLCWAKKPGAAGKGPFRINEIIDGSSGFFGADNMLTITTTDEPLIVRFASASDADRWHHACLEHMRRGEDDAATGTDAELGLDGDTVVL
jgi:hypothetical protein